MGFGGKIIIIILLIQYALKVVITLLVKVLVLVYKNVKSILY